MCVCLSVCLRYLSVHPCVSSPIYPKLYVCSLPIYLPVCLVPVCSSVSVCLQPTICFSHSAHLSALSLLCLPICACVCLSKEIAVLKLFKFSTSEETVSYFVLIFEGTTSQKDVWYFYIKCEEKFSHINY